MAWEKAPASLVDLFERVVFDPHFLATVPNSKGTVERRKLFGNPKAFCRGNLFCGLFEDSMMMRLPEDARRRFLAMEGGKPFEPEPGRQMHEYVTVPASLLANPGGLRRWLGLSLQYALSLPAKDKPKKAAKKAPAKKKAAKKKAAKKKTAKKKTAKKKTAKKKTAKKKTKTRRRP